MNEVIQNEEVDKKLKNENELISKNFNNRKNNERNVLSYYIKLVIIFSILAFTFWIGFEKGQRNNSQPNNLIAPLELKNITDRNQVDMSLYWEAFDKLKEKYVDS
jgi:hypothetical protein